MSANTPRQAHCEKVSIPSPHPGEGGGPDLSKDMPSPSHSTCDECLVDCAERTEDQKQFQENGLCRECNDRGFKEERGDMWAASLSLGFCGSI
jgi:hypothetical protein